MPSTRTRHGGAGTLRETGSRGLLAIVTVVAGSSMTTRGRNCAEHRGTNFRVRTRLQSDLRYI